MISKKAALNLVKDKKSLYEAFIRNRYFMPKIKEAIITGEFLVQLRDGKFFIPKADDVKVGCCVDPPSKAIVANELHTAMYAVPHEHGANFTVILRATADLIKAKPPNRDWLLTMLHTFKPDHAYFHKAYVKRALGAAAAAADADELINNDGFFDDLPLYHGNAKAPRINLGAT